MATLATPFGPTEGAPLTLVRAAERASDRRIGRLPRSEPTLTLATTTAAAWIAVAPDTSHVLCATPDDAWS